MARFMQKGVTKVYWVPTIASASLVPTTAEITSGTNMTPQINEINGFSFANDTIETRSLDSTFVANIPGEDAADDSSLVFYEDKTTNPIKTAIPKGSVGNVVIFYAGTAGASPAAGDKCDVWPAQVAANVRQYTAANEAAMWRAEFAMTAAPGFDKTVT